MVWISLLLIAATLYSRFISNFLSRIGSPKDPYLEEVELFAKVARVIRLGQLIGLAGGRRASKGGNTKGVSQGNSTQLEHRRSHDDRLKE